MRQGMDEVEARAVLDQALAGLSKRTYADLRARAPRRIGMTRFLGIGLGETFAPVGGGYTEEERAAPSGTVYNVTTDVFWDDYDDAVLRVLVCVAGRDASATRPLCGSTVVPPPPRRGW